MMHKMSLSLGMVLFVAHGLCGVNPSTVVYTIPNNNFENFSQLEFIAITPDGTKAYVTDIENNQVHIIDVATRAVLGDVDDPNTTFNQPFGIAIKPDGTQAYVTNFSGNTVSIIDIASDTATGTLTDTLATLNTPYAVAFTPDGTKAYVTNKVPGGGVSVVNTATNTITGLVTDLGSLLSVSTAVAFTPDGAKAYVANIGPNTVSIIDVASDTALGNVTDLGGSFQLPLSIAFTPDGTKAYVANNEFFGVPSVSVVDVNTDTVTGLVTDLNPPTLLFPFNVVITADGTTAYVTISSSVINSGSTVSMIDVATDTVIGIVGNSDFSTPRGLAITPNGKEIYVVNEANSTISIIGILATSPTNIQGCKTRNAFLTRIDFINKLTWETPASGTPISYNLYRDAELTQLITALPGTVNQYYDHNRNPNVTYTYYITSVDASGCMSAPSSVAVTQSC